MYIFNTQLVHHRHSQFGDLGSTHLGRTGAASSSPRSEKSETLSSESSTYWDRGGGGWGGGDTLQDVLQRGGMSGRLSTISFPNWDSQVSENNNSTYSFWHKEMCEKHTLCCRRKVQPVYSRIAKQLHRVLGNHMVAIMTTPSAPQLTGQPPVEQTEGSVHIWSPSVFTTRSP